MALSRRWIRHPARSLSEFFHRSRLNIGVRLTACFVAISLLMVVGDILALSQFRIFRHQVADVSRIDQMQVAVLRVHTDLLSFRDKLRAALANQDAKEFASEATRLCHAFLEDVNRAKRALSVASSEPDLHGDTLAILETLEGDLPTQIDTLNILAENGDWEAAGLRLDNQLQALGSITSALVDQVEADVTRQRAAALQHIDHVQQWFFVLVPVTATLTLATAGTLGMIVTRSITRPLTHLDGATQALGRGDFRHEVPVMGTDELARLAETFNYASQKLQTLYHALSRSELRFRSLIEHSSDLITTLDEQGNIRYVSPSSERVIGYKPEELLGKSFYDFVHPEDVATAKAVFGREPAESVEFRIRHADGTMPILEAAGRNLLAVSDVASIVVNARDITARRHAEEALYQSEKKYRAFFEQNAAASYISKPDGRLVACNPAFLRMFGFSRLEELEGSNLAELYPHPSAREHVLRQLKKSGYVENYQQEYRRKDGKPLFAVANAFGRFDTKGELVEICGFLIDETLRRRTEEQLRQAQKIEAVGRLAGAVAHDFNNLLGVIIGYGQMLLDDPKTSATSRPYIEQIFKAGVHGGDLTRQLLAFSRKQVMQPTLLDLNEVVAGLEKMLLRLIGEDISLQTVLSHEIAPVKADTSQIEQVIINLAVNSRDAMPRGGKLSIVTENIDVDAQFAREHLPMKPGNYVRISVSDTGVGMDPETLSHVFEPFFSTKADKGTGLGLATVYSIMKQSGGYVWPHTEVGRGTTFSVYLPAMPRKHYRSEEEQPRAHVLHGSETILLVEDAIALRVMTRQLLQQSGYAVLEARDVEDAIQIAERHRGKISLLLTDVVMPQMSGRLLAEHLVVRRPEMKVLYMSGYTDDEILRHGILNERTPFLEKPFTRQALAKKVREVLDGLQAEPNEPAA